MAKLTLGPKPTPPAKPPKPRPPPPPPTLFEQLFPCAWRGINFPISSMKVTLSQDLVEHKYWGIDAASVEATGRAPMQIEAEIPFVNGIVPGKGETWGVLYPTTFRQFLTAFADRSSGVLNHPELSGILCKPVSLDFSHDAQVRDGVKVTARWVETVDPDQDVKDPLTNDSPIQAANLAALDLDASKDDLLALVPEGAFPEESFESLMNKVTGFVDSLTLTAMLLANKPGQILYRVHALQDSLARAANVLSWPVNEACEATKAAVHNITDAFSTSHEVIGTGPQTVTGVTRKIARFVTPARMSAAGILAALPAPNTIDDLLALNPVLVQLSEVGAGTLIRFYHG